MTLDEWADFVRFLPMKGYRQYKLRGRENLQCHFEYDEEYRVHRYPQPIDTTKGK